MSADRNRKARDRADHRRAFRRRRPEPADPPATGEVWVVPGVISATPGMVPTVLAMLAASRPDLLSRVPRVVLTHYAPACPCCGRAMRRCCAPPPADDLLADPIPPWQ